MPLLLASASPRRSALLQSAGVDFQVEVSAVDEDAIRESDPRLLAERLAVLKADDVFARNPNSTVLAADTVVAIQRAEGWKFFGKPVDEEDAFSMLDALQGRRHSVVTAYAIRSAEHFVKRSIHSQVVMQPLLPHSIRSYIGTGEPYGKAGGYAVQGIAQAFITEVQGSYSGVVGLPLAEVVADLQRLGLWDWSLLPPER